MQDQASRLSSPRLRRQIPGLLAASAVLLGACGGDDDPPSGYYGPATETEEESTGGYTGVLANTYEAARSTCADSGVSETARQLGLPPSSDPLTVAEEYGTQLSTGEHIQASADGCLAGLEGSP